MTLRTNGFQLALVKISDSKLNNKLYQKNHKLLKRPIKRLVNVNTIDSESFYFSKSTSRYPVTKPSSLADLRTRYPFSEILSSSCLLFYVKLSTIRRSLRGKTNN